MAATPATLATYDDILRRQYLPDMQSTVFTGVPLLDLLQKRKSGAGDLNRGIAGGLEIGSGKLPNGSWGKGIQVDFHISPNFGVGARAKTQSATAGYLPTAGSQGFKSGLITSAVYYGNGEISGNLMDGADSNRAAVIKALDFEIRSMIPQVRKQIGIDLIIGNTTGILATCSGTGTGTTLTVDTTRNLVPGQPIVVASATGTGAVETTVSTIDSDTQLTVADSVTYTSKSIFRAGLCNTNVAAEYGNAMNGLAGLVSTSSTYAGIDRSQAAAAALRSHTYSKNLTTFAVKDLDDAFWAAQLRNGKINLVVCDPKFYQAFGNLYWGYQQWPQKQEKIDGGYPALAYEGAYLVKDPAVPAYTAYGLDTRHIEIGIERDLDFMDDGKGAILVPQWGVGTTQKDAYGFACKCMLALVSDNPSVHFKMTINPLA